MDIWLRYLASPWSRKEGIKYTLLELLVMLIALCCQPDAAALELPIHEAVQSSDSFIRYLAVEHIAEHPRAVKHTTQFRIYPTISSSYMV